MATCDAPRRNIAPEPKTLPPALIQSGESFASGARVPHRAMENIIYENARGRSRYACARDGAAGYKIPFGIINHSAPHKDRRLCSLP
jgi:hypothetical protein